tara:strand:- start:2856 stop:3158 length:303 start_codon:yes stop_codon:yes gene_type:complete
MTATHLYIKAWTLLLALIGGSVLIDFILRTSADDFYQSGLSEPLWFGAHIIAFTGFLALLIPHLWQQRNWLAGLVNGVAALFLYLVIIYGYILGLGMDSL